jgi:potassium-dependent mechanosensitive channel
MRGPIFGLEFCAARQGNAFEKGTLLMQFATALAKLLHGLIVALLLSMLAVSGGFAEERTATESAPPSFDTIKNSLDEAESAIEDQAVTAEKLAELRQKINELAGVLRDRLQEIEPRAREVADRLKQLGPAPGKDAPVESQDIADERKELTADSTEFEGAVKQARLLLLRVDQLSERISEKRHTLYARELFAQTQSILDPYFWMDAIRAVPVEWRRIDGLIASWQQSVGERVSDAYLVGAALSLIAVLVVVYLAGRWASRLADESAAGSPPAWRALLVFCGLVGRSWLAALAALLILKVLGLLTDRTEQVAQAMVVGIAAAAVGRGVAMGLFAPGQPDRRLALVDDLAATILYRFLVWASVALALTISLQAIHKAAFAPLLVTVATNALFAAVTAALLALLVARLGRLKREQSVGLIAVQWLHPLALVMASLISAALLVGFASFAAFLSLRVIVAAVVFGALYLFLEATKAWASRQGVSD